MEWVWGNLSGVPFHTTESDTGVGRRNEVHEYPLRDLPYADDLGRRAREFQVNGYVVGENYLQERDALIEALEAYGPGELIHPKYGMLNVVVVGRVSIRESHSEEASLGSPLPLPRPARIPFPRRPRALRTGSTMRPTLWGRPP